MDEALRKQTISDLSKNKGLSKESIKQSYLNQQLIEEFRKAKEKAEKEYAQIKASGEPEASDIVSNTQGITDTSSLLKRSLEENGIIDTIKKTYDVKNKSTNTLLDSYNDVTKRMSQESSVEDYYKDKFLANMIQSDIKKSNNNIVDLSENLKNTTLRGTQGFVTGLENAVFAKATNNEFFEPAINLVNRATNGKFSNALVGENRDLTSEEVEGVKSNLLNMYRDQYTKKGEQDINRQLQLNELAYDGLAKFALDAGYTIGDMTIPILAGIAGGQIGAELGYGTAASAKIGEAAALAPMFTSVYGRTYTEAIDSGANSYQANLYANAIAYAEIATELIGGETMLSVMVGRPTSSILGKLSSNSLNNVRNRVVKGLLAGFIDVGGESLEEVITAAVDPVIKKSILGGEDIKAEDLITGAYEDAIGALGPSLIFMGLGKPVLISQINTAETNTINTIRGADYLTNEQKADMIKKIQDISADARWGVNENYNEIYDTVYGEIAGSKLYNDLVANQVAQTGAQYGATEGAMDLMRQEMGYVNNQENLTTQEILDKAKKVETNYKGTDKINSELEKAKADNSAIRSVEATPEINKVQENIKSTVEKLTGKQVVFVNVDSEGETDYGFTDPKSNNIYINVGSNTMDTWAAAYHEIGHHYKLMYPDLYNEFVEAKNFDDSVSEYDREEEFGDYIGRTMTKPENIKSAEDTTRTLFENLKDLGNKVASNVFGAERNNTRVSEYNLNNKSYLGDETLEDAKLEKRVLETISANPTNSIETKYAEMKKNGNDTPVKVKQMIAEQLGTVYNALNIKRTPQIEAMYRDLVDDGKITETGTKFSAKKYSPGRIKKNTSLINGVQYEEVGHGYENDAQQQNAQVLQEHPNLAPYIYADPEKEKYLRYTTDEGFYKNFTSEQMDKITKDGSMAAAKAAARNEKFGWFVSEGNIFGIENIKDRNIPKDVKETIDNIDYKIIDFKGDNEDARRDMQRLIRDYNRRRMGGKRTGSNTRQSGMAKGDIEASKKTTKANERRSVLQNDRANETKFSKEKNPRDQVINNQRNEIVKQQDKIDELEYENKGLKRIIKGLKSTGREQIRNVQSESNRMHKTGRETELKMKGQLVREGKKYSKLSEAALDIKYENQLERKAHADGITYGRDYKNLFIGLRRAGDTIDQAYSTVKSIYDESQRVNKAIDESIKIINELRSRSVYRKLPKELKSKIDAYDKIWAGSRQQSNLTFAKRLLTSATAKEFLGKVALSKGVRNKIMNYNGEDIYGKGTESLQELFNGSKELAESFLGELTTLRNEVKEFQARNLQVERTKQLEPTTTAIGEDLEKEKVAQDRQKFRQFIKKFTNKTMASTLMTLKTEIQAVMGGNAKTPMMVINDNLQNGEIRRKQAIMDVYNLLNDFRTKSGGLNRLIGSTKWTKTLEKSLAVDSKWTNTGVKINGVDLRLPRSMMMSLAMHLLNDQNMQHISGGIVGVETDDNGVTTVKFKNGEGVRVPNEELYRRGKGKEAYDRGKTIRLSQSEVEQIVSQLTDEEKAFVQASQEIFKHTTRLINQVSNKIFGYDLATVDNYFPIHVWTKGEATGAIMKGLTTGNSDALNYLLNPGWLQERVSSFEPIYLENLAEVLNRSVNSVANFYGYAEALRDNNIILNGMTPSGEQIVKAINYLTSDFMRDYNKLTRYIVGLENTKNIDTFRSFMAANTLTFNIGTWLTQPMSFFNTLKYYTSDKFLKGVNPVNNHFKLNSMIKDYYQELGLNTSNVSENELLRMFIAEATPFLDYRGIDYKMTGLNKLLSKSINDKIGAKGIQLFDDLAVTAIARMQAYVLSLDPNLKFGSEEYFKRLGSNLTQILSETQPEYSQVNRSNMFRSNNTLMRALSLFGTPANQMFNNVAQSTLDLMYNIRTKNTEGTKSAMNTLLKSVGGVVASSIAVALIRAARDTIRGTGDEEITYEDRFWAQFIVSILSPTLVGDDIATYLMSKAEYGGAYSFDFSTPDTAFMNGLQTLGDAITGLGKEGVSPTKKTVNVIKALGTITPIDTRSLVRFTEATMKWLAPDLYSAYSLQNNSTIYKKWSENSDTQMSEFYKAYTATRQKELDKLGYHKADKENNVKSNLKETRRKALEGVFSEKATVDKYMEILFNYKS